MKTNIINKLIYNNTPENKIAFIEDKFNKSIKLSYKDFINNSLKLATYLSEKGVKKGDYISVMINMSIELYETLVALWTIGAIPIFFDVSAKQEYIEKCLEIIKPKYMVSTNKNLFLLSFIKSFRKIDKISIDTNLNKYKPSKIINEDLAEQGALVTFTSGSTNLPKTVVRTHQFLLDQYEIIYKTMNYNKNQIDFGILPVFTLSNLASGITTVIPNTKLNDMSKLNVKNIVKQITDYSITSMTISPAILKEILYYAKKHNIELKSINKLHIGGGPVFPNMLEILNEDKYKNIEKHIVYGSSEAEPISFITWEEMMNLYDNILIGKGLPLGKIVDDINVKIINDDLQEIPKTTDINKYVSNIGEIIVSGPNVLKGYYNEYGNKENKIIENNVVWHRTGDCGYFDENNNLWLIGNKKSIIKTKNKKIYPIKIQCILNTNFNINTSAVLKHNKKVFIILENKDKDKFGNNLTLFKNIDNILFINKIPMDKRHNAKVDYNELKNIINKEFSNIGK